MFRHNTFWLNFTGALLLAIVCATPILMSSVMDRGHVIAKLSLAEPFAFFALASIILAKGWRWVVQGTVESKIAGASLVAFLALAGISTLLSEHPGVAIFGGYSRRDGFLAWAAYAAFFFALLGWTRGQALDRMEDLLDFLLLASVIPSVYAIQQRLGLDFFFVPNRDLTRPNGTLGNAVFLGAYLAILLPLAILRCWQVRHRMPELVLWSSVALLLVTGLLITQSRGPLLACTVGVVMLACLGAGYQRSRRTFFVMATVLLAVAAGVAALNMHGPAQRWARDLPVLSRLAYNLEPESGGELSLGTRSTAARLGIWRAANETFLEAPPVSKWIGFGPESAYTHYFPYLPDTVMQVDGYFQSDSYDRFHADTLDIGLNFGALGWLVYCGFFAAVFLAAARALFGFERKGFGWVFAGLPLIGGAAAAALAYITGFPAAIAPAVGLGMGGSWFMLFLVFSWLALGRGLPEAARVRPERWALLAGLTSSLLVFWIDAQVNIPVLTTRVLSLGVAALILAVASTIRQQLPAEASSLKGGNPWGVAFPIIAACASLLPAVIFDASKQVQETERWWLSGIPIICVMAFGAFRAWISPATASGGRRDTWRWIFVAFGLPAIYVLCHWWLVVRVGPVIGDHHVVQLATVTGAGILVILLLCVARAVNEEWRSGPCIEDPIPRSRLLVALPVFAVALLTGVSAWTAIKADIGSTVAMWASGQQRDVSDRILLEAVKAMPYERQYQRQRTFDFLGHAMEDITRFGSAPEHFPGIKTSLDAAEKQARESARQFPGDPWIILALANALQIRALPVIRSVTGSDGRQAALEADEMFARAYEIFPNQPLLLRNWAQLRFNEGDNWGAYRLLDRMEGVIPHKLEPYYERVMLAKRNRDSSTVRETIERATAMLDRSKMARLLAVADLQQ